MESWENLALALWICPLQFVKQRLLCRDRKQYLFHDVTAWLKHSGYNTKLVLHFTGSTVWYCKCGGHKHNFRILYSKNCCNWFTFERVLQKRDNLRYSIDTKVTKMTLCPWMENVNVGIFIAISSHDVFTTLTHSSAIADRQRDAPVTSIRKTAKWNFWATLLGDLGEM